MIFFVILNFLISLFSLIVLVFLSISLVRLRDAIEEIKGIPLASNSSRQLDELDSASRRLAKNSSLDNFSTISYDMPFFKEK